MKKSTSLKVLVLLIVVGISGFSATAQLYDTVIIQMSPTLQIKVSASNLPELQKMGTVAQLINQFQTEFAAIKNQIDNLPSYDIRYVQNDLMTIDSMKTKQVFVSSGNMLVKQAENNRCTLQEKKNEGCGETNNSLRVVIYFDNLNELSDTSIINAVSNSLVQVSKSGRFSKNWFFGIQDDKVTLDREEANYDRNHDQIALSAGMGGALIKNTGLVNISFVAGFMIGGRGYVKHKILVTDEMNYIFNSNSSFTINNFLSLGYAHNFSSNPNKPQWYGLEVGFLTNKKSNFFDGNTYRLGLIVNPVKSIQIKPNLYFEDNFQRVYPGIGVSFGF